MGLTITMVIDHLLTVMILPVVVSNYFMALTKMVIGVISPYLSGPHHNSTYNSGQTSSRPHTSFYPKRWQIVGKIAGYFREIEIVEMIESWLVNLPHPTYPHNYNHGSLSFWNHDWWNIFPWATAQQGAWNGCVGISADTSKYNERESLPELSSLAMGLMKAFAKRGLKCKAAAWAWIYLAQWMTFIVGGEAAARKSSSCHREGAEQIAEW